MISIPAAQRSGIRILPGLGDTNENLEATVRWTAEHGGKFVLAGGLTLADQQHDYFFGVLRSVSPTCCLCTSGYIPPVPTALCAAGTRT